MAAAAFVSHSMADRFPTGTTVGAYPAASWLQSQLPPAGAPPGSATETAVMAADGSLSFAALAYATEYFAAANVSGWRYVRFATAAAPAAGAATAVDWLAVVNLGVGVSVLGTPFRAACQVALDGSTLVFRGDLACSSNGAGFRMFDLPAAIPAPATTIRLMVQSASTDCVGLNLKADRTVELAGNSGTFVILDGCSIPGWTD